MSAASCVWAQSSGNESIEFIQGLPITGEDTVREANIMEEEDLVEVPKKQLPHKVRKELDKDLYRGWKRSKVRFNRKTGLYFVSISNGSTTRTFGLTADGDPVTYDETSD